MFVVIEAIFTPKHLLSIRVILGLIAGLTVIVILKLIQQQIHQQLLTQ